MNLDQLSTLACRLFLAGGFALLLLGMLERVAFVFGYTITSGRVSGGRLLEMAAVALVFAIALLLRDIRNALRARST
jgi:hypothetical protein